MEFIQKKSTDTAVEHFLAKAADQEIPLAWDRYEGQLPVCGFCEAGRTGDNPRIPFLVVDEIEECYNKYGVREIDIFDYDFTMDRDKVITIAASPLKAISLGFS